MYVIRFLLLVIVLVAHPHQASALDKIVIAADGGGGKDLIENSLEAATLAAALGVEYLQLPVVMTADDQLLVFRDLTLDRLTDVGQVFPERQRSDGSYYVIDFTLNELRQLRLLGPADGAGREFPLALPIPTLAEELRLLRRLETTLNRQLGIVVEIRQPWFHRQADKDISSAILDTLARFRYTSGESKAYLQCFDPDELQKIHDVLMVERQMRLPLIQLIGANDGIETRHGGGGNLTPYNYDWIFTNTGLRMVASYAVAISLPLAAIVGEEGKLPLAGYIAEAHRHGLMVLGISLDAPLASSFAAKDQSQLLQFLFSQAGLDGISTNRFQDVQRALRQKEEEAASQETRAQETTTSATEETEGKEEAPPAENDLPPFFKNLNLSRPVPVNGAPLEEDPKKP